MTPTAANKPCQVISAPAISTSVGSRPILIARRTLIIVFVPSSERSSGRADEAPHLAGVVGVSRRLTGQESPARGYSSPQPSSGHPERERHAGDYQGSAGPDQVVAAVALHLNTAELALSGEPILVTVDSQGVAGLQANGLRPQAGYRKRGGSRGRRCIHGGTLGGGTGAVDDVGELEKGRPPAAARGRGQGEVGDEGRGRPAFVEVSDAQSAGAAGFAFAQEQPGGVAAARLQDDQPPLAAAGGLLRADAQQAPAFQLYERAGVDEGLPAQDVGEDERAIEKLEAVGV